MKALAKAGIVRPAGEPEDNDNHGDDGEEEAPRPAPAKKGRKRKAETVNEELPEAKVSVVAVIDPDVTTTGRVTRSRAKKMSA